MATPVAPGSPPDPKQFREFLNDEVDGVYIYSRLSELEEDESLRDVYRQLAEVEQRHMEHWRGRLREIGEDDTPGTPSFRARTLMWIAARFGVETVLPIIKSIESGAAEVYLEDPIATAAGLPHDEDTHARVFGVLTRRQRRRGISGSVIGRLETRHRALGGGNALRAAVLGATDGLVSNLALVAGFAGASPGQEHILLAGFAGLLAGASSMALGEWISVTSSREASERQLRIEAEELAADPEAERDELALIYQAKGLPKETAEDLATRLISNPETALSTLAREELGIVPEDLGSPWAAAIASFLLFATGALIPVVPFFFGDSWTVIAASAAASGLALFGMGALITLLTGRHPLFGGARQMALGLAAATLTFIIGGLIGSAAGV
jgi:vacuolar iron transporter family protein